MAKFLFLQNLPFEYMGPMYISALLKKHGHSCRLFVLSEKKNFLDEASQYGPDIVAFTTMTGPHKWVLKTAALVKNHLDKPVLLGGAHPTFFPEIIHESPVDMICIGEGDRWGGSTRGWSVPMRMRCSAWPAICLRSIGS